MLARLNFNSILPASNSPLCPGLFHSAIPLVFFCQLRSIWLVLFTHFNGAAHPLDDDVDVDDDVDDDQFYAAPLL
jgi:hypothetical protein